MRKHLYRSDMLFDRMIPLAALIEAEQIYSGISRMRYYLQKKYIIGLVRKRDTAQIIRCALLAVRSVTQKKAGACASA